MAPKWPLVNNGPEHINEHATYLRDACNQLQAVDRGRQNQVPWNIVQPYITSTIALIGKVLQQPAMSEILHHIQDAAKWDITVIKTSVGLSTTPLSAANFSGGRVAAASWAQVAAKGSPPPPPPVPQGMHATKTHSTVTAYKDRAVAVKLKDHGIAVFIIPRLDPDQTKLVSLFQRFMLHIEATRKNCLEFGIRS
jgi:hypothetical protein